MWNKLSKKTKRTVAALAMASGLFQLAGGGCSGNLGGSGGRQTRPSQPQYEEVVVCDEYGCWTELWSTGGSF